jgi:hypothetical protein
MSTEWKILQKSNAVPQFPVLYATLNTAGSVVISRSCYEALGSPEAFIIMFDPLKHRIGLRPAAAEDPNAYAARVYGKNGAKIIRAHRMLEEFGIRPPGLLEFKEAKIADGILLLDLQNTKPSNRAHSSCRARVDTYEAPQQRPKLISPFPWVK